MTASPRSSLRRTALTAAALALVVPASVPSAGAAPSTGAVPPPAAASTPTATSGGCGQFFDDFAYSSSRDERLSARGWRVRSGGGGPGVSGGAWSPANVTFTGEGTARAMRLQAETDGTPSGTVSAEVSHQQKFFEGTWAARVRFTDAPVAGADGDPVVQTFFGITPLHFPDDPDYSEIDFEYLPNGGWGQDGPTLFLTTWETYRPDPWRSDNLSTPVVGSLEGWRDLVMQVDGGVVRYFVDGEQVAEHGGYVYPDSPMLLAFNLWFIDLDSHTGGVSRYEQDVEYVYHSADEVLTPGQVQARVAGLRAAGTDFVDGVVPGACNPTTPPAPAPPAATPPVAAP
ncbi:glycosyl hydrolase, partial [Cellulomonas bogoriensis 69B4 = DSM 16987]